MTQGFLTPEQREQLKSIQLTGLPERWQRCAHLLLLYDEGQPTRQVSQRVGLSRSRSRYWRRQFLALGMEIFPGYAQPAVQETHPAFESPVQPGEAEISVPLPGKPTGESPQREAESPSEQAQESDPLLLFIDTARKLATPGVLPADPLAEAGRKVLRYHFGQMLLHEDGTRLGEDSEELHDMRVATRRMRAAMEVFGEAFESKALQPLLKGMRQTGRFLGRVRDLDVFLEKAVAYQRLQTPELKQGLRPLLNAWKQEREASRRDLLAYLESEKYQSFKLKFYAFTHTPEAGARPPAKKDGPSARLVQEIAPVLVYTRLAAVRAYDPILENASIEQLHALRIELKKLRYTVEFFREVFGNTTNAVINDAKKLQDHLGELNDAQVATGLLRDFLTRWDAQQTSQSLQERQSPQAVMAYLAHQYEQRHQLMRTFHEAWSFFNRPEFRQNLALAVSVL